MQKSLHSKHANAAFKTHKKYSEPVKTILPICRHYVRNMQNLKVQKQQTLLLKHAMHYSLFKHAHKNIQKPLHCIQNMKTLCSKHALTTFKTSKRNINMQTMYIKHANTAFKTCKQKSQPVCLVLQYSYQMQKSTCCNDPTLRILIQNGVGCTQESERHKNLTPQKQSGYSNLTPPKAHKNLTPN